MSKKYFSLLLPVYKQGDDLASHIQQHGNNPVKGLLGLAEQYIEAADVCKKVAEALMKVKDLNSIGVDAGTHHIGIYIEEKHVKSLLAEDILQVEECDVE